MTNADPSLTVADLADAGVKRISVGGSIARYAMASFLNAGREMKDGGFTFVKDATPGRQLTAAFASAQRPPPG